MNIEKKNLFTNIVYSFSIIFYLVIGVGVLTISHFDFSERIPLLSALILLSSVPHILIYAANREKKSYLIIGLVGTAFGILFLSTDLFDADEICMIWGVIDICRGLTEIINLAPTVRKHKIELIEIAISLGDIVVGILLCIHLTHGTKLHLIYLGIAFLITAVKNITEYVFIKRKEKNESSDNN